MKSFIRVERGYYYCCSERYALADDFAERVAVHRFWDAIVEPVLEILQPEIIVEVGSDYGLNTRTLLEFCRRNGARLHVVDPMPKYDVAAWQRQFGHNAVFHLAISLDAISSIDRFDVVLLDGDHNWYTVFHELRLTEDRCAELVQPFPLVILHDIGWPYGRRDGYYTPDNIPDCYLNPYERKGMRPDSVELLERGGLNQGFRNAIREGGSRNGVLTAVEDFLAQTEQVIELVQVPGLYGLGILVPAHLIGRMSKFLKTLDLPPNVARHIERVEEGRLEAEIGRQETGVALRQLEAKRSREVERLRKQLRKQREALQNQNRELQQQLKQARQRERQVTKQLARLEEGL